MLIQWYPGHMAKARRMLTESLKLIDVVVEIVDARAPLSTRNPDFDELFMGKDRIIILNKSDLASPQTTSAWINHFRRQGILAAEFVATVSSKRKAACELIAKAAEEKVNRLKQKGVIKTVRTMIVGIPNVGKSTFINCVAGSGRTIVGDKPGVTKGKQWVKITPYLELMDTPGLLWPKLENEDYAKNLAFIGSIKDDILDIEQLSESLLRRLAELCPNELSARYKGIDLAAEALLPEVAKARGFRLSKDEYDIERACRIVLDEFRGGKIAKISLETPVQLLEAQNAD